MKKTYHKPACVTVRLQSHLLQYVVTSYTKETEDLGGDSAPSKSNNWFGDWYNL
ncbi:MAG: hypothetical protein J5545_06085 [Bacteroidaceae bacterium]|nr:hypothetical protein [Bacteroidaceae bacterium]